MLKNNHEHRYMDAGNNKMEERSMKYSLRLLWVLCICTMTLLGLSVNANAQVGMNNQFCPGIRRVPAITYFRLLPESASVQR